MIIEMALNVMYRIFDTMLILDIPDLPTEVFQYITTGFEYISSAAGIVANYLPLPYLMTLFFVVLAVDIAGVSIDFLKFVLAKIPFLNIR